MPLIDPAWWTEGIHEGQPLADLLAAHEFGKVFAFLRSRGWSVQAISARTGLDEYRIREYIKGGRRIEKHAVIERIADGLEIDRRLCRVGDLASSERSDAGGGNAEGVGELRELLARASSLDQVGLVILAEQTNQIRTIDRVFGARAAERNLRGHLETLVSLRSFSLLPTIRARLADLFCDAAALAGWVALDNGDLASAWRHHEQAKDAGRETGSVVALSHALAQQAYVLLDLGEVSAAVQLAEHALSVGAGSVPPVLMAWLHAVAGELHAIAGTERSSKQAFERAARLLPADPSDPSVPYIILDEFHLARWRGAAYARLGHVGAIDDMHYALTGMDSSWLRARAQLHVDLAHSLVSARQRDQAGCQLELARALCAKIGSGRQKRRIRELESVLRQPG